MADEPDAKQVEQALNALDFPAGKDQIVAHAQSAGAPDEVVRALRALPLADYANVPEVLRSIPPV